MKQIRPFVQRSLLNTIYKCLVQPQFDYCDVMWGSLSKGLAQSLQNRAVKIITQSNYNGSSYDILKSLGWQDLATRRLINTGCWVYKSLNNLIPNYLSELFVQ